MAKLNMSQFHRRVMALEAAGHAADAAAVRALGGFFIETVVDLTAKDTNRAANGWIQAGREAGVTDRAMLPYKATGRRDRWIAELREEEASFQRLVDRFRSFKERDDAADSRKAGLRRRDGKRYAKRSRTASYKANARKLRKFEKRLARVREEIAKAEGSDSFVFFSARFSRRNYSTVRTKIYGGTGRIEIGPNSAMAEFVNREPHVRAIEGNPAMGHPIRTAAALTRTAGFAVAGDAWLETARRRARVA